MSMEYMRLSDCAEYRNDRTDIIDYDTYITTDNMLPNRGGITVAESLPDATTVCKYVPGDILLSNIRPYFKKIWLANREGGCSNDVLVVKAKDTVLPKFLFYVLSDNNFFNYDNITSKGTKMPRGTPSAIMKYLVPNYNKEKQQRIVSILSVYDSQIEVNNKRIELLERLAENLYKEWFIRFHFPGHETTEYENGIPKGWRIERIGNIARIKSGFAFKSEWWSEDGIPAIKIKDIQSNTVDLSDLSRVPQEYADLAKQFYVAPGDLIIALTGATIGKIALIPYTEKMTVNQRVGKFFLGKTPCLSVAYLYCFFQQEQVQNQILSIASSNAAQPNISPFDIERLKILYNEKIVKQFNEVLHPHIQYILKLRRINTSLIKQRDLLLPRLMSGKLTIK